MRKTAVAAAIVLAVGCVDAAPTAPTAAVEVPLSGRVIDVATNVGVPSATVTVGDSTSMTDADGAYSLVVPHLGVFTTHVDARLMGEIRVTGPASRGDILVYPRICIARYGRVTDARTGRPIAGATVELGGKSAVTEWDGWYRLDVGCPTSPPGFIPVGTNATHISHPKYVRHAVIGRGIFGAYRADYALQPQ